MVASLEKCKDLFLRFGGHPQAAGFTLPTINLPWLTENLVEDAKDKLADMELAPSLNVDCEISPILLDAHNMNFIQSLQPFGTSNPEPVFLTRSAWVLDAREVGSDGSHLKMRIGHSNRSWDAIAFNQAYRIPKQGSAVDIVYKAEMNDWGKQTTLQLNVIDFQA